MDTYNCEQGTDHYVMVGLCTYYKEEKHKYSDAQIASANAIICAFNSFLSKRPTMDLNRYLLEQDVGRPLEMKGDCRWKVDQDRFDGLQVVKSLDPLAPYQPRRKR